MHELYKNGMIDQCAVCCVVGLSYGFLVVWMSVARALVVRVVCLAGSIYLGRPCIWDVPCTCHLDV